MLHHKYSPSSRHRWSRCPGSTKLIAAINPPEEVSEYASEGTAAHALAAECLENGKDSTDPHLQLYLDYVRALPGVLVVEQRLTHPLHPEFGGTPDALAFSFSGELTVVDLKWGRGQLVDAAQNEQLLSYTVLAARNYPEFETARIVIVQPRADGEQIKSVTLAQHEVEIEENVILDEIEACEKPDAPLVPGPVQCQWCSVKAHCPALHANTQLVAGMRTAMPSPEKLTPAQLVWLIEKEKEISGYLRAVYAYALANPPPGFKVVQGQGNRRWKDEPEALKAVKRLGKKLDEVAPRTLLSPAQMESRAGVSREWIDLMTERPAGSMRLVHSDDPRPAYNALDVFEEET